MYLYYVCWIFDVCQGHSVEQWPTLRIQIFETKKTMDGAKTRQWEGDACITHSLRFQTVEHASSVGQGVGFQGLRARSPVRTMLGQSFYKFAFFQLFSYFLFYLIFSMHFNFF